MMEWADRSPYAFQKWYTATNPPSGVTKVFVAYLGTNIHGSLDLHSFFPPSKIQPVASFDQQCTAIVAQFTVDLEWIKVPCDEAMPKAYFICEVNVHNTTEGAAVTKYRFVNLPYAGCPAGMLGLNVSCLKILSLPSGDNTLLADVCKLEKMDMFKLPHNFDQGNKRFWTKEQEFVLKLLALMAHRWPSTAGQNGKQSDQIILSPPAKDTEGNIPMTEVIAVQFSDMEFSHIEVANISDVVSDAFMHVIVCSKLVTVMDTSCLPGHSACHDKTCILNHYFCDGIQDCPDYSDEKECDHVCHGLDDSLVNVSCFTNCIAPACVCHDLYFQCTLGGCVPWSRVCDGITDCGQGEDEALCVFSKMNDTELTGMSTQTGVFSEPDIYSCLDGPNISSAYRNDLVPDCPMHDDEQTFEAFLQNGSRMDYFSDDTLCEGLDETTCVGGFKGVCYPRHLYCIHETYEPSLLLRRSDTQVCRNGGHLRNCELHSCPSHFKCPAAFCIPIHAICNGRADCPNSEDEEECKPLSCPGMLLCRQDHVCVHPYEVRSGRVKCPLSKDDKALTNVILCPLQCLCHGHALFCENVSELKLSDLPLALRILVVRNSKLSLDSVTWQGEQSFIIRIEMSLCNISIIRPKYFRQCQSLNEMNLQHNIISHLPDKVFHSLKELQILDLSYNRITKLQPAIFEGTKMLKVLKLQCNRLTSLAVCTFGYLPSLQLLNLSNNLLTYFGNNILCNSVLEYLTELDVSLNNFLSVDPTFHDIDLQRLVLLNGTPSQICCYVPKVPHCYPRSRLTTSSCKRLLNGYFNISVVAASGCVLVGIACGSIAWLAHTISKTQRDRRKSDIITMIIFIIDFFKGVHFVILAVVDVLLKDNYGLYDDLWRRFGLCIVLNTTSYASLLVSTFVSLTISIMRMQAIIFPFNVHKISTIRCLIVVLALTTITLILGYLPYSGVTDSVSNKSDSGLCLGIILPMSHNENLKWKVAAFVCPIALMLCIKASSQIASAYSIAHSRNKMKAVPASLPSRRPAVIRCLVSCLATLCSHMPLLLAHVATAAGVQMSVPISEAITILTLVVDPVIHVSLYIFASPSFLSVFTCRNLVS